MNKKILKAKKAKIADAKKHAPRLLKVGDPVMVISGGNPKKGRVLKGQVGKIMRFLPKKDRVVVQGLNMIKRHKRAVRPGDASGVIQKEGSLHLSNVMYYSETLKKPVRLRSQKLEDGKKVRGFTHPEKKTFEQIA
jgi:large subunit ribosomal protein L24